MSLRDELQVTRVERCPVKFLLAGLPEDVATELAEIIADKTIPMSAVAQLVESKGWEPKVSRPALANHRRGECRCRR